jgi:TPR repeat protein
MRYDNIPSRMAFGFWPAVLLLSLCAISRPARAQTVLQHCLGIVPGREPTRALGATNETMAWCKRLPAWDLYQRAGQVYQSGDHAAAARLAQQAAEAGNPEAQGRLATMYAQGDGVPRDPAAALHWMQAAVAQNEPLAEHELGYVYEYGRSGNYAAYGVADDWDEAARLWKASASQGVVVGEFDLGRAYQYGIGVPVDINTAIYWYDKAAAQGHAQAQYFAKYLRDNHGFDGSTRDDYERSLLGPLMGRTMPFAPPTGTVFHHLSQRLAFVRGEYVEQERAKAMANYQMRLRRYQDCRRAGGSDCMEPGPRPR